MEPIVFEPIVMERVWGGRMLENFGKKLPAGLPVGESWEIVDRPEAQSVVHEGMYRGTTLHELWNKHRESVFGGAYRNHPDARFPLLLKLLDARDRLSVQVHPPSSVASLLQGEPKTEMWYFLQTDPGASIYAGLARGSERHVFEESLAQGTVESLLHKIQVKAGDSIFIPSGRVHAIGGGNIIVEIQQNSDTTYRVFDWNRTGLDGKRRKLHIEESLVSIQFEDWEPHLNDPDEPILASCPYFYVQKESENGPVEIGTRESFCLVVNVGETFFLGDFPMACGMVALLPCCEENWLLTPGGREASFLHVKLPVS